MPEWANNFHLIFWGSITLICIVPVISGCWYKIRKAELEAGLKRDMIERGMSADEIERILQAPSNCRRDKAAREVGERAR
jgi:hypothetical protein